MVIFDGFKSSAFGIVCILTVYFVVEPGCLLQSVSVSVWV
jgi:hypothetical protein